nr:hypothetical protein [uncultured Allomuricauda sp.]
MDKFDDKSLEEFVDRIMEEAPEESPSADFTKNVMQQLEVESPPHVFEYKPILSGRTLFLAFVAFVALVFLLGSQLGVDNGQGWFKNLNMETWFHTDWDWVKGFTFSKVTVYAFLSFGLLFFAQVPWLKKRMDKMVF